MANSITHAGLPFPVYGALYSMGVPFLDADGDPTDPGTPDTEISLDGAGFADCTNEVAVVSTGFGWITFTAAEMTCDLAMVAFKAASGPKATCAVLQPRRLPAFAAGTSTAGANGTITLAAGSSTVNDFYNGMIIRVNSGTGPGQARMITDYVGATLVASVAPNWETNPGNDSVYEILLTELAVNKLVDETRLALAATVATAASIGTPVAVDGGTASVAGMLLKVIDDSGTGATFDATTDSLNAIRDTAPLGTAMRGTDSAALATGVAVTSIANDVITAASINTGAFTADAFASDSIAAAAIKADAVTKIQAGLTASIGAGGITSTSFAAGAITAAAIATGAIGAAEVAADAASEIGEQSSDLRLKWGSTQPS